MNQRYQQLPVETYEKLKKVISEACAPIDTYIEMSKDVIVQDQLSASIHTRVLDAMVNINSFYRQ